MDVRDKAGYEKTPENEAAEEAAFEAACGGTDLEPAPGADAANAEAAAADELQQQEDQQEAGQEAAAPAAEPEKEPTVAEVLEQLKQERTERQKLNDKVFGKVGELQQKIDAIKTTASGLHPKAKDRLKLEFVELHNMLFGDEDDEDQTDTQQHQAEPAAPQTPVAAAADPEEVTRRMEIRLLKRDHPDYEQVVNSPEFEVWKGSVLDPEHAAQLEETWDADFISSRLTEFKNYQAGEAKALADKQIKQNRLSDAINPRGVPRVGTSSGGDDDEEAAMLEAYGKNQR